MGQIRYLLFKRDLDGLLCGVRCPARYIDTVKAGPTPAPGTWESKTLTAAEWARACEEWGGTLPLYGYQEALLLWHVE